jgi:hypothetical protein
VVHVTGENVNEQDQSPETDKSPGSSQPSMSRDEWREQRHAEREARWQGRAERWSRHSGRSGLVWGVILILLGIVFFLQNSGIAVALNWWAVFILIPAFWSFVRAWESYREHGRLTRRAASSAVGGTLLTVVALVFLFNIGFGTLWPLLLIAGGVALILTGFVPA